MIAGTGAAVPERVVPNKWFNELLGEDVDTWLRENVQSADGLGKMKVWQTFVRPQQSRRWKDLA